MLTELVGDVGHDAVVRGGRRREHRHVRVEQLEDPADPAVVRAEVVAPVGDAVRLVDDEQADRALDRRQDVGRESLVREALRRDEQDVDRVSGEALVDGLPLVDVAGVDRRGAEPEAARHRDLVAHQREQRADDQGRAVARRRAGPGSRSSRRGSCPSRPLDDERPPAVPDDRLDRLALTVAKGRVGAEHRAEVAGQVIGHGLHRVARHDPGLLSCGRLNPGSGRTSAAVAGRRSPVTCTSPMLSVRHLVEVALRGLVSRVPSGLRRGREIELAVLRVELGMESGIRGRRRLSALEFHSVWIPAWSPAWRR